MITAHDAMMALAALAEGAFKTGRIGLYLMIEEAAFVYVCEEGEWVRGSLIRLFPWGLA